MSPHARVGAGPPSSLLVPVDVELARLLPRALIGSTKFAMAQALRYFIELTYHAYNEG
jgi:hypothetical protein